MPATSGQASSRLISSKASRRPAAKLTSPGVPESTSSPDLVGKVNEMDRWFSALRDSEKQRRPAIRVEQSGCRTRVVDDELHAQHALRVVQSQIWCAVVIAARQCGA